MTRFVLASDFHLTPDAPGEVEVFVEFTRSVARGADAFYVLGDLFESWTGRKQIRLDGYDAIFDALRAVADSGTEVVLFHGNRDFLLGRTEAGRAGGRVVGEELAVELCGRRYLLLHGDSLCTADVDYQRSKPLLRSWPVRALSYALPIQAQAAIAARLRRASSRSVSRKPREQMELVGAEVRRRLAEGFDALICGHVHAPGARDYGTKGAPAPVFVLGDWHGGGVYAEVTPSGVELPRFAP